MPNTKTSTVRPPRQNRTTAGGTIVLPDGTRLVYVEGAGLTVEPAPQARAVPEGWHETTIAQMQRALHVSKSAAQGILYVLLEKGLARIVGRSHDVAGAARRGPGVVVYEVRNDWSAQDLTKLPTVVRKVN